MDNEKSWIDSNVPQEILDSKIFKFEITLPSVFQSVCEACNLLYPIIIPTCQKCGRSDTIKNINKMIVVNLVPDVRLSYDDVEKSLEDIPSQYAYWSAVYAETKLRVNQLERSVKTVRGRIYREINDAQRVEKVRINADSMKHIVEDDSRLVAAESDLNIATMQCQKLYYMVEALRMKADLARTLTSLKREEMNRS